MKMILGISSIKNVIYERKISNTTFKMLTTPSDKTELRIKAISEEIMVLNLNPQSWLRQLRVNAKQESGEKGKFE